MRRLNYLLAATSVILALPTVVTTSICHARFAWHWNETGQCGATDAPSEVFVSFLIMSLLFWGVVGPLVFFARKYA